MSSESSQQIARLQTKLHLWQPQPPINGRNQRSAVLGNFSVQGCNLWSRMAYPHPLSYFIPSWRWVMLWMIQISYFLPQAFHYAANTIQSFTLYPLLLLFVIKTPWDNNKHSNTFWWLVLCSSVTWSVLCVVCAECNVNTVTDGRSKGWKASVICLSRVQPLLYHENLFLHVWSWSHFCYHLYNALLSGRNKRGTPFRLLNTFGR